MATGKRSTKTSKKPGPKTPAKRGKAGKRSAVLQRGNRGKSVRGRPFKKGQSGNPRGRPRKGDTAADYLGQAITKEELCFLVARAAKKNKPWAIRLAMEYMFGRPWTEAEILADREIKEMQRRIDEARQKGNDNGNLERKVS